MNRTMGYEDYKELWDNLTFAEQFAIYSEWLDRNRYTPIIHDEKGDFYTWDGYGCKRTMTIGYLKGLMADERYDILTDDILMFKHFPHV